MAVQAFRTESGELYYLEFKPDTPGFVVPVRLANWTNERPLFIPPQNKKKVYPPHASTRQKAIRK